MLPPISCWLVLVGAERAGLFWSFVCLMGRLNHFSRFGREITVQMVDYGSFGSVELHMPSCLCLLFPLKMVKIQCSLLVKFFPLILADHKSSFQLLSCQK